MRTAFVTLCCLLWLSLALAGCEPDPEPEVTLDDIRNATVALVDDSGHAVCAGTIIQRHYIVTNAHCVGGKHTIKVGYHQDDGEPVEAVVIWRDNPRDRDAAVLRVNAPAPHDPLMVRCTDPVPGEEVTAVGHPFRIMYMAIYARVSHQDPNRESRWNIYGMLNPGNSGGTVVDEQGRLVGLSTDMRAYARGALGITGHTGISGITSTASVCGQLSDMGVM